MAAGVIKTLSRDDRSYYDHQDIQRIMGVSQSKAYTMIRNIRRECIANGTLTKEYPQAKIPKKIFNKMCAVE